MSIEGREGGPKKPPSEQLTERIAEGRREQETLDLRRKESPADPITAFVAGIAQEENTWLHTLKQTLPPQLAVTVVEAKDAADKKGEGEPPIKNKDTDKKITVETDPLDTLLEQGSANDKLQARDSEFAALLAKNLREKQQAEETFNQTVQRIFDDVTLSERDKIAAIKDVSADRVKSATAFEGTKQDFFWRLSLQREGYPEGAMVTLWDSKVNSAMEFLNPSDPPEKKKREE